MIRETTVFSIRSCFVMMLNRYEDETEDIRREALMQKRQSYYPHVEKKTGELTTLKKLAYAAPAFSITSLTMLISIHGTLFFTKLGAKVAFLGFFTAVARTFDVVTGL